MRRLDPFLHNLAHLVAFVVVYAAVFVCGVVAIAFLFGFGMSGVARRPGTVDLMRRLDQPDTLGWVYNANNWALYALICIVITAGLIRHHRKRNARGQGIVAARERYTLRMSRDADDAP